VMKYTQRSNESRTLLLIAISGFACALISMGLRLKPSVTYAHSLQINLRRGCNEIITPSTIAPNSPGIAILNYINPTQVVAGVWQFDNSIQVFHGLYFNDARIPVDGSGLGPNQSLFICVSAGATVTGP
jgi:hypothetical protein